MARSPRFVSILIIPDGGAKTIQFKLRSWTFKLLTLVVLGGITLLLVSILLSGRIAAKVQLADYLAKQNEELTAKNRQIEALAVEVTEIRKREQKLRILASGMLGSATAADEIAHVEAVRTEAVTAPPDINAKPIESTDGEGGRDTRMQSAIPTLRPVDGWITRRFSAETNQTSASQSHTGVDMAAATGTPIHASASGVVDTAGWDQYYGNLVVINHGFGYETAYGHCSRLLVKKGDLVRRGEAIALVGSSGRSTAPHLHYEVRKAGVSMDPLLFFVH